MQRVLIIEDDCDIGPLLALHARDCGAESRIESHGTRGLAAAQRHTWDLIILDWRLPGLDGLALCRQLRSSRYDFPILMLTARTTEADRITGLDAGADDYVAKPFSVAELKARMRSQLRRAAAMRQAPAAATRDASPPDARRPLVCGEFVMDPVARAVSCRGRALLLTTREFDLLGFLMRNPRRVFSRQQLLAAVWGTGFEGFDHTVNSHINRLRTKIEADPAVPSNLVTVWGCGYRFESGNPG